ncbi:hypothetical protein TeGR_g11850, partial [Tetraparma gracilis]
MLSEAASLKAQAVSLFKQSCFAQAAGIFANLSALASSISPPTSESTSFATAGYNNSALCYLKLNEWDKSMAASANCLALGDRLSGTSAAVVEAVLFKARFRLADAQVSKAERAGNDKSIDVAFLLDEAVKNLMVVLQGEPDNEQARKLAERGMDLAARASGVDVSKPPGAPVIEEVAPRSTQTEEEEKLNAALGAPSSSSNVPANQAWGMGGSDWASYEATQAAAAAQAAAVLEKTKKLSEAPPQIAEEGDERRTSVKNLVDQAKMEKRQEQEKSAPAPSIGDVTTSDWTNLESVETSLNSTFNSILQSRSKTASVAAASLKTAESNYSDGWRGKHAAR